MYLIVAPDKVLHIIYKVFVHETLNYPEEKATVIFLVRIYGFAGATNVG